MNDGYRGYGRLLAMQMRQRLGLSILRQDLKGRPKGWWKRVSVGALAVVSLTVFEGFYIWLMYNFAKAIAAAGMLNMLLFVGLMVTMVGTLIMGTVLLLSILYLNKDAEALAALPVSSQTVFAVKMSQAFLGEAATSIPLIWPILIIYGVLTKAGALYYVKAVVVWLCALSLPLILSALITMPLMRWGALWRRRDLMAVVGGILVLVVSMGGQIWLQTKLPSLVAGNAMMDWLAGRVDLFDLIAQRIPPLWLAMRSLTTQGFGALGYLAGLLLLSALLIALTLLLAGRIYQRGVSAQMEVHTVSKPVKWEGVTFRQRSPRMAIFLRDTKLTLRTPIYLMNTCTVIIIMPVMLFVVMLTGGTSSDPDMAAMMDFVGRFMSDPWMIALIAAGLSVLFGSLNVAASTCVSREGRMFAWSLVAPVPFETQAEAKAFFPLLLSWVMALLMCLSLGVAVKVPTPGLLAGFALSIPMMVPSTIIQLIVDILRPKLNWTNQTEAIKQNMNSMLGMLFGFLYAAALIALAVAGIIGLKMSAFVVYMVFWPVAILLVVVSIWLLRGAARTGYSRVEL